ncbi:MAG: hypothetical protein HC831_22815 [Chloroflexia bacterium]|nr:hypothetical protein [Chloroflexia bacterium]
MINPLLSRTKTDEVIGTGTIAIEIIKKSAYTDQKLTDLNAELEKNINKLSLAQNRKRKNDETDIVWSNEEARDNDFKVFKYVSLSLKYRPDKTLADKGRKIYEIIERHGTTLYNLPHKEQTAKMKSLFEELSHPNNVSTMDGTELPELLNAMIASNQKFLDSLQSRSKSDSEKEEIENVAETKKSTKVALEQLVNY